MFHQLKIKFLLIILHLTKTKNNFLLIIRLLFQILIIETLLLIPRLLVSIFDGIMICINDEHSLKAESPIKVTEEGISIRVNDEHSLKAEPPIKVTEEGIAICVNDEHLLKAKYPIEVTEEGIAICVNDEHSKKA